MQHVAIIILDDEVRLVCNIVNFFAACKTVSDERTIRVVVDRNEVFSNKTNHSRCELIITV